MEYIFSTEEAISKRMQLRQQRRFSMKVNEGGSGEHDDSSESGYETFETSKTSAKTSAKTLETSTTLEGFEDPVDFGFDCNED